MQSSVFVFNFVLYFYVPQPTPQLAGRCVQRCTYRILMLNETSEPSIATTDLPALLLLPISLRINLRSERVLKPQRNAVNRPHQPCQQHARRLAKPQRRAQEAQRAAMVHRRAGHVEREASDDLVHQDAEVVAQVCARDAERPHAAQYECVATQEQADGQALGEGGEEGWVGWLGAQGALVYEVTRDAKGEDGDGEGVAAAVGVVSGEAREGLVVVFAAGGGIPEGWVEDDEGCGGCV